MRTKPEVSTAVPAEVTITVGKFQDVLAAGHARGGRGTTYRMKLKKPHPRVVIKGDNIFVTPPDAVTLRFTVASSAGDRENYYPVGITFLREGERGDSDLETLGLVNFPQGQIHPDGRSLSITDSYREALDVRFKFSVVIQRGSDGKIGIIDPGIVHEGDE